MNRYETYQDSGIPWLGEVPAHWEIKRLKFSIKNISNKIEAQMSNLRYFGLENIQSFTGYLLTDIELESEGITNEFKENDVLFGKLRPYLAKVHLTTQQGLISTEALVFRPTVEIEPKFLFYFCVSPDFIDAVNGTTFGSKMPRASWDDIGNFKMLIPSKEEQTAIADYLDNKLGEIDALISKQETLLEKLAEQRTAIITHAVTKGLNAHAPMKNSGVAWLGDVPEHWETWKITHAIDLIGSGTTPKSDNADYYDGEILWVTTSELRENFIDDTKQKITDYAIQDYSVLKIYPKNSVAIAMYGATIGRLGILSKEATFNQACCVFGNSKNLHYKFLFYWLWYRRPILISLSNGGGQPNLSQDDLKKLKIPLPKIHEQTAIANYLDEQTTKIDRLSDTVNQTIASLKEYRSALITQAVTGKIKVI